MDALEALTSVTLTEVEAQIADVEQQLLEATAEPTKRLASLKALRLFVRKRDGVNGERFGRSPKAKSPPLAKDSQAAPDEPLTSPPAAVGTKPRSIADRAHGYLAVNGPMKLEALARAISEKYQSVYSAVTASPRFKKTGQGDWKAV